MMTSLTCLSTAAPSGDSRVKGERWLTGQRVYTRGDVGVRNRISEWEVVCGGVKDDGSVYQLEGYECV